MVPGNKYKVFIQHNLVTCIKIVDPVTISDEIQEDLHVAVKLATNYRENGNIDGEYIFANVHKAKDFGAVALDFIKKVIEKSEQQLTSHNFFTDAEWYNKSVVKS